MYNIDAMKTHLPGLVGVCASLSMVLLLAATGRAQDEGLGTFNDLVDQSLHTLPTPPPTPAFVITTRSLPGGGKKTVVTETPTKPFSDPTPGFEFDYRFTQQKTGLRLGIDSYETRPSFAITAAGFTDLSLEYFHIWSDGSNDTGANQTAEQNGLKPAVKVKLNDDLSLSFPFSIGETDTDTWNGMTRTKTRTESFVTNPFVTISRKMNINDKPLKFFLISGYRFGASDKSFTNVTASDVHAWKASANVQLRAEYGVIMCSDKTTTLLAISGSGTWTHLTNFYSSDGTARPDANSFALATGLKFKPEMGKKADGKPNQPLALSLAYQYDGFNRDSYQHSVGLSATYTFF